MTTLSVSEAKMKLSALADAVFATHDEFASWRETMRIRCDAELMREIKKGLGALKKDKVSLYTLEELFDTPA